MYMNNPLCLPINSNPGGVFPPQQFPRVDDQLLFTAKLVTFMLDFKDVLDRYVNSSVKLFYKGNHAHFPIRDEVLVILTE